MKIYTYDLTHITVAPPEQGLPTLKQMMSKDIEAIPAYADGWFRKHEAIERLETLTLFAAVHSQEILFANWVVLEHPVIYPRLELSFSLPQGWAWGMYLFVHTGHRRKGVGSYYRKRVLWELAGRGYTSMGSLSTNPTGDAFIESTGGRLKASWFPGEPWPVLF